MGYRKTKDLQGFDRLAGSLTFGVGTIRAGAGSAEGEPTTMALAPEPVLIGLRSTAEEAHDVAGDGLPQHRFPG